MKLNYLIATFLLSLFFSCSHVGKQQKRHIASDSFDKQVCRAYYREIFALRSNYRNEEYFERIEQFKIELMRNRQMMRKYVTTGEGNLLVIVEANNYLIGKTQTFFNELGVTSKIKNREVDFLHNKITYQYLDIIDMSGSFSLAMRRFTKHMDRAGVQKNDFDILGNFLKDNSGNYDHAGNSISLADRQIYDILLLDQTGSSFKHEITHAYLYNPKIENPDSLLHILFGAGDGKSLGAFELYSEYLNFQELYTYANNLYWKLNDEKFKRVLDMDNKNASMLDLYSDQLTNLEKMINHVDLLIDKSTKSFESLKEGDHPIFGSEMNEDIGGRFSFLIEKNLYTYRNILPEDNMFLNAVGELKSYIQETGMVSFLGNEFWDLYMVPEQYRNKFLNLYKIIRDQEIDILNREIEKNQKVKVFTKELAKKSSEVSKYFVALKNSYIDYQKNKTTKEEVLKKYLELKREARKLGLIARGR